MSGPGPHFVYTKSKFFCAFQLLRHRGPDWNGITCFRNCYLAHERLAINGLLSGSWFCLNRSQTKDYCMQPFRLRTRIFFVFFTIHFTGCKELIFRLLTYIFRQVPKYDMLVCGLNPDLSGLEIENLVRLNGSN